MGFMQKQITNKQTWLEVETKNGTEWVPAGELKLFVRNSESLDYSGDDKSATKKVIWQYTESEPISWENKLGYGARLSAPGYMDCTEWTVFNTVADAEKYLDETYPEDEEN